jgi:hypothetical protein
MFGKRKNRQVNLVEKNPEIINLHMTLFNFAKKCDSGMNDMQCGENFVPHITVRNKRPLEPGEKYVIDTVYVVEDVSSRPLKREVMARLPLKI